MHLSNEIYIKTIYYEVQNEYNNMNATHFGL